ncbi:Eco57I restriction-modification methylase domain-containing protein [Flavobacterium sp.]|uniref:Eco57I restriction-modification methylase domain-containing protein n=1 Tax=Flavobacterium sp. TaxID=239 RepID=UPI00286B2825|nr:TaqI-like C-terminal specificity domain-containing protein [Flavobacterium sp.]
MEKSTIQIAFEQTQQLINHFEAGIEHYLSPNYQEAEVRKEYIDKFYSCLGWDVNHDHQKNPFEQEVKIEKAQRQQGALGQKRADYAFFLSPNYKQEQFFVEAKKPSRTLRQNKDDYFQTAKYGWNAGTGVSILTDFEEIVIIDCRFRPDFDTILQNQIKYYNYKEFRDFDTFEEFYWIFSHEALVAGNLSKYIEQLKKPKGTATQLKLFGGKYQSIDESFLNYIDAKRFELATAFYQNNTSLDAYELTEATQRTIDRIVFIRFLEDKLIETENIIHNIATANHPWAKFVDYSKYLDSKYNGVVFKPLFIDDKNFGGANDDLFRALCSDLDHTNTPYDFNYIPIHILGSIYERFLGKVVVIENGKATIEVKPEVRKAGGVFYTPKYIVDYIVKNTVGKLIDGKTPKQITELTFADIACGSGSFLIGVFEYLLDYHNKWYNENPNSAKKDGCKFNEDFGVYVLSIQQKQNILLNNIYGVDIDLQATEVTQLSLFLKMLEDETTSTANDMMVLFHEKILPNLSNNIKCGNSLIGTDILNTKLDLDLDQERKLNPFDFKLAFPKVFGNSSLRGTKQSHEAIPSTDCFVPRNDSGFDAIVGNPPYYKITDKMQTDYFAVKYTHQNYQYDLYLLFMERYQDWLKPQGVLGIIIPNTWLQSITFKNIRQHLVTNYCWQKVLHIAEHIFKAVVDTHVLIFEKNEKTKNNLVAIEKYEKNTFSDYQTINQNDIPKEGEIINLLAKPEEISLFTKIKKNSYLLKDISISTVGTKPFQTGKGKPKQTEEIVKTKPFVRENQSKPDGENWLPLLRGSLMHKYENRWNSNSWIQYGEWLAEPRNPKFFEAEEKIIIRQTSDRIIATIIEKDIICRDNLYMVISNKISHQFILGILNSKLTDFYYHQINPEQGEVLAQVKKMHVEQLPVPILTAANQEIHDTIVNLVNQMLQAKKQQQTAVTERDKNYLDDKCKNIDTQINELVYELYGLNEEEIRIVEKS